MELTIATARLSAARILAHTPRAFYRTAINAFFFVMGMVFASWAVRIPDIKAALHMNDAALGSVLLATLLIQGFPLYALWVCRRQKKDS